MIKNADYIFITVPTPISKSQEPDLSYITSASNTISENMKMGCTVILESTVYPGVTEEVVKPILEKSGFKCGNDFKIGYSPERINPGDEEHTIDKVTKVVSGMDDETTNLIAELYSYICPQVFKARSIKTAEAAKVIENIQRDLNIALINEFSLIFARLGLNTKNIIDAASTKWNFVRYTPGLIGGHCIPVDPYYLVHKAKQVGYDPKIILAGRALNNYMPIYIAQTALKGLNSVGKINITNKILIMGLTYKENVADIRETPARDIINELKSFGAEVYGYDPFLDNIYDEFGITGVSDLDENIQFDCVIVTLIHDVYKDITLQKLRQNMNENPILIDVKAAFVQEKAEELGFLYFTL
jgi:UDPglucose 6-dehydrogenase/UDP-N-acetyl-D-galactosamine dehydrogenase